MPDVLVGEEAEGWPPEVLVGEDEVGRRAEDEGRPPAVLVGEEAEGWPLGKLQKILKKIQFSNCLAPFMSNPELRTNFIPLLVCMILRGIKYSRYIKHTFE